MEPSNADRVHWMLEHRYASHVAFERGQRVTDTELAHVIAAARAVPPALSCAPYRLVIVDERTLLDALGADAPCLVVVLHGGADLLALGCVAEAMWVAARACRLDAELVTAIDGSADHVRELLGVPEPWRIACALRLGHAATGRPPVVDEPEVIVDHNRFRAG